ncbi:winged helix-turn-helix domain-containing protein [Pseudonocardia sp. RS11V-5]|uniref:winged helix-turn-helix domain-containing protein n=1 Tax=Pseudonocardia terrae TaxID=2905831 RepID=UPI001E502647|nr:winged helix-turn-helix domain-containing protein [Pseudonocardia terrae]MCE3555918.1 winged helix-turn-helix domain-containing protein [Pseudonocardia terrae]
MSRTHPEVARALALLVARGRPGDRLPAERDLARRLGVGRAAVRRALSQLAAAELVSTRRQSGTYVRGTATSCLHCRGLREEWS